MRRVSLMIFLELALLLTAIPSKAINGKAIIEKVNKRYETLKDLSADFQQTFYWKLADETQGFKGKFYIKKPNMLRLETEQQVIVTDGDTVWIYAPENNQVIISSYEESEEPLNPQTLLFEYTENYQPIYVGTEKIGNRKCYLLKLTPCKENQYITEMKVWVDKKAWLTLKAERLDINGNVTTYILSDTKVDSKLDDSIFKFKIPKGVEIVDMSRSHQDPDKTGQ